MRSAEEMRKKDEATRRRCEDGPRLVTGKGGRKSPVPVGDSGKITKLRRLQLRRLAPPKAEVSRKEVGRRRREERRGETRRQQKKSNLHDAAPGKNHVFRLRTSSSTRPRSRRKKTSSNKRSEGEKALGKKNVPNDCTCWHLTRPRKVQFRRRKVSALAKR